MHKPSTRKMVVSCLVTLFLLVLRVGYAHPSSCIQIGKREVVTMSQVAVQVFSGGRPLDGAVVSLIWEHGQGIPAATGETDSQGALQIEGVPPGLYLLRVTLTDRSPVLTSSKATVSTEVSVRVVPSTELTARLIAINLVRGMGCSPDYCEVAGTVGPLPRAPKCLTRQSQR